MAECHLDKLAECHFGSVTMQEILSPIHKTVNKLNWSFGKVANNCSWFIHLYENGSCQFPVSLANETNSPSSGVHIDYYIII